MVEGVVPEGPLTALVVTEVLVRKWDLVVVVVNVLLRVEVNENTVVVLKTVSDEIVILLVAV
jgi:hypothetical protein